jgi:Disulphide bond corrector protein DsbC
MKPLAFAVLSLGVSLILPVAASADQLPFSEAPAQSSVRKQSVRFLFPEQVTIAANKPTSIELHFRIADGMHVNSHNPREPELIPTNLVIAEMPGVTVSAVEFPKGMDYSLAAEPNRKLSVYSGEFVLKMKVEAQPGDHLLQGVLRYQACDTNSCYPPRTIPVVLDLQAK